MLDNNLASSWVPDHVEAPAFEGQRERELASRVLQGVSAIFLLLTASRCPQLDELQSAVDRISEWMGELDDSVCSAREPHRRRMLPVVFALGRAVGEVRQLAFPSAGYDHAARSESTARSISHSATLLELTAAATVPGTSVPFTCCAADAQHISESRTR